MRTATWVKMLAGYESTIEAHDLILTYHRGAVMCVGGPALVYWVSPTEEELFKVRLKITI